MEELKLGKFRILIVDDTPKNIQVLGTILRQEDYQLNIANNGKQAIDMAEKVLPDLILLDIMMPEMDGFQTCKTLKKMEKTKNIPVIFLSAKSETEDIVKGFEMGAADYVTKPFNASELLSRVKTHLQLKYIQDLMNLQNHERKVLLQVICHDLTNPLVGIKGIVDLLETIENLEDLKEFIPFLSTGVDNALSIVELIRTMQSIESDKKEWTFSSVPIKSSVEECLANLKQQFQDKEIKVELNISDDFCILTEKTSFIQSVLPNILSNAFKFSYNKASISITAEQIDDEKISIIVTDQGIGMSKKLLEDIFDVESKTARPGTKGETGTGYGLPLIQKFMKIYGGDVSLDSSDDEKNKGTTVTLTFKKGNKDEVII